MWFWYLLKSATIQLQVHATLVVIVVAAYWDFGNFVFTFVNVYDIST